jgi:ubiquinone/menaquinone biosynthesis C-methylase UbiE
MPELTVATKQNIEQAFDDSAATYDRVGPAIYEPFAQRLVDWLPLKPGATMLDVATGAGAVLLPAARLLGPEGRVVGIDLSDGLLRQAEALARAEDLTNVELRKMDAEHLEFRDQSFDFVTCAFSLYFFPNMESALPNGDPAVRSLSRKSMDAASWHVLCSGGIAGFPQATWMAIDRDAQREGDFQLHK